jgi:membrane protease YdiL (CAAX protease family)
MFFVLLPLVLIGGGIEEAGWSYVLRPQLNKKFGLVLSSLIVAVIWTAWHIPVFLPQGRIESLSWFGLFAIGILGESFALGAIIRITKSVFLCVLFHTLSNAVSSMFTVYSVSLFGTIISTFLLITVSIATVFIYERKAP